MCLKQVSMLCHFCLFLSCVLGVFNTRQWRLRHAGSLGLARVFDYDLYRRMRACFVYLCHHPRSRSTKLLTQALFFGPCRLSLFIYLRLAIRVHVAGDLNKTISFVDVLSTSFVRALLGLIHQSPSCPMQLSNF